MAYSGVLPVKCWIIETTLFSKKWEPFEMRNTRKRARLMVKWLKSVESPTTKWRIRQYERVS